MRRFLPISLLLLLVVIGLREIAAQQYGLRNPGFLASLQSSAAAGTWSSNNMTLWLVADDLTGLGNNTSVVLWTNRIAGRLSLTNTQTAAVIKSNNIVNGKAAICFDGGVSGTNSFLYSENSTGTNWNAYVSAQAATFVFVIRQRGISANNALFQWYDGTENVTGYGTFTDAFYFDFPNSVGGRVTGAQPAGWDEAWHIVEMIRDNGVGIIAVDGTNVVSGSPTGSFTSSVNTTNWLFGATAGGGAPFFGEWTWVGIWNVNIGSSERDLLGADLSTTYGTPPYHRP